MIKSIILAVSMVSILGCAQDFSVNIHEVTKDTLVSKNNGDPTTKGFADWDNYGGIEVCDIYIMPKDLYEDEYEYHETLGHELRHCFEGHFHD